VQANVIDAAFRSGVRKLLFLGSSCIYPRMADQPIREEELLKGVLEPTNEPYAISKIAGIKLCESYNRQYGESLGVDYRSVMPANLYGPNDNYHSENSHVVPALLRRVHMAMVHKSEEVVIWGTGAPRREFLYVDDLASAVVHVMQLTKTKYAQYTLPMQNYINVGYGTDVTIEELTNIIAQVIGYSGRIIFDITKPDGVPQKLLDSSRINALGWHSKIDLKTGIKLAYQDFLKRSIK
jgi:GDP-L-fucose synthase